MRCILCIIVAALSCLLLFTVLPVFGQEEQKPKEWTGKLRDGTVIIENDLKNILADHKKWTNTGGKEGKQADLRNANLSGADLGGAWLTNAILIKAKLINANLEIAYLIEADLTEANLSGAKLYNAFLSKANLRKAKLINADLTHTTLNKTDLVASDLSGANLDNADLRNAWLIDTNLSRADLFGSDLKGAHFEPTHESIQTIKNIDWISNLSELKFLNNPKALVSLRDEFKKAGLRNQEREITYAIKHTQRLKLWNDFYSSILNKLESIFNLIFFEWTCAYGMSPGRCFLSLIVLIFLFTIPYTEALSREGEDGIWVVWITDRVRKDLGREEPVRLQGLGWSTIKWGFYFSVLSAFSIGWRELNVGNWIARMQRREYTLRATGWVRTVSGIQSLTSVYLLALWVLTYFGRPFEAV
jgi:hypothetical protein